LRPNKLNILVPKSNSDMKRILLSMVMCATMGFSLFGQVTSISVEAVYTDDGSVAGYPVGHTTYRIFANCTNAADRVSTVFGDADAPLVLNVSGSGIWNHALGGAEGKPASCALIGVQEIVGYDSFYTFGYECITGSSNSIFPLEDPVQPWKNAAFQTVPYGQNNTFLNTAFGGAWVGLPDHINTEAGSELKVLLAQITTDGSVCGILNLQVSPNYVNNTTPVITQTGLAFSSGECGTPGCTDPEALNYDVTAGYNNGLCLYPCALTIDDYTVMNPTCGGDADGEVTINPAGQQGFVAYSFNGEEYQTNVNTYGNLENGMVTVLAKDLRFENELMNPGGMYGACEAMVEITLETTPLFIDGGLADGVTCAGDNDGCVNFMNYGGGTGTLAFMLYQGANPIMDENGNALELEMPSYCGLAGGTYHFEVMDENGCTESSSNLVVTSPAMFNLIEGFEAAASCFNSEDGTQVINWGGGTGDIMFSLEDDGVYDIMGNVSNLVLENLMPGDYMLYAIDANGCTDVLAFSLAGGPAIEVSTLIINPSCPEAGDGSIGLMATGGTGALMYSFNGADFSEVSMLENLAADFYMGYVMDENVCIAEIEIILEDPAPIAVAATGTDITCAGLTNGSILVNATGGTEMLLYSLDGSDFTPSPLFENLGAAEYMVYVEDVNGCPAILDGTIMIAEPSAIDATATSSDITCNGFGNGAITVSANGGTAPYLYSVGGAFSSVNPITGLEPDSYTVVVQDANGCTAEIAGLMVEEPAALTIDGLTANSIDEDAGGNSAYTVTGGTPIYSYEWVNGDGDVVSTSTNLPDLTQASDAGEYTVTVTDANGCETSASITVTDINDVNQAYSVSLYPNPSNGQFRLTLLGVNGVKVTYTILDEAGRVVVAKELSDFAGERIENIDLSNIASGIYMMHVNIGHNVESLRLIIQ
jgi:hypothetical protein